MSALTAEELDVLNAVVAETIEPVAPPPSLRRRVLEAVRALPRNGDTVRRDEGRWMASPSPGVKLKRLSIDEERGTATLLMSLDAGARVPQHEHRGPEQTYVVSGSCSIGDLALRQGDFHRAAPGSRHGELVSKEGCVLLLVVDVEDYRTA